MRRHQRSKENQDEAILLIDYGDVDKLELPDPKAGPGEVRVNVATASINPIDWKLWSGALRAWMPPQFPAVLGRATCRAKCSRWARA